MMKTVEIVTKENWKELVNSPYAVLMLAKSDCAHCAAWTEELNGWLAGEEAPQNVRFGKLYLDKPGLIEFKKANPWIAELDVLPFNVIYAGGEQVKKFAGAGIERLQNRLRRLLEQGEEPA